MAELQVEAPRGTVGDGLANIRAAGSQRPIWWGLTWAAITSQYRRTYLGPWWLTARMLVFVLGLTILFGILFKQDLSTFLPYVASGYVCFTWMTGMILLGSTSLVAASSQIKSTPGPLSIYAYRAMASQTIQFGHDALVIVVVLLAFRPPITWTVVLLPLAVAAIVVNGLFVGLWLGPTVARFRDVGPMVQSIVQVLFFFTPIFWIPSQLTVDQRIALSAWNPLAYLLEFFRAPLLGTPLAWWTVAGVAAITLVNVLVGLLVFSRNLNRIAYLI
ncbi:MAG: ABC transporter permease [Candidatus Nanopelagicales bacterium]